jgi:hypothetical protein
MQHANTIGYELQTARKTVIDNVLGLACKYLYTLCAYPPFKNITISRHCQSKSRCKHVVCSFPSIANMDKKQLKIILSISPSSLLLGWVFSSFQNFRCCRCCPCRCCSSNKATTVFPEAFSFVFLRTDMFKYRQIVGFLGFIGRYEYNIV